MTKPMNVHHKVGPMTVMTSNVTTRGDYMTLVILNGAPFDYALSGTIEEAIRTHEGMVQSAEAFEPLSTLLDQLHTQLAAEDMH